MSPARIYLSPPHIGGDERALVAEAFDSNWIAPLGPHVDAFEREFAEVVKVPHATALASGTAALHLAMRILGVGPGDEVLCSSLTFCASANPIVYEGGVPVFVDSDASWTVDPNLLEEALKSAAARGKRPKALIAVDLYGQCADYDAIVPLCEKYGVPLIEDAAEALGSSWRGQPAGGFGLLGVFSFNGNKIITTSGGGMLVSASEEIVRKARFLATQARDPAPHYQHSSIGFNYRLSNVLAAIGRGQLRVVPERVAARRRNFEMYREGVGDLPGVAFMPEAAGSRANRWLTCLTIDPDRLGVSREEIRLALEKENIEARPVWKPLHLQPVFSGCRTFGGAVSERIFEKGLCLPSGSNLTDEDRRRVIRGFRGAARR
ncbi:MAG: DegT/DnrJ/EryC1/StrS family aminotransferase [Thermoanaerobaculia bacterium]